MDGNHSMRLQNVNVYVWTGPQSNMLPENKENTVRICCSSPSLYWSPRIEFLKVKGIFGTARMNNKRRGTLALTFIPKTLYLR